MNISKIALSIIPFLFAVSGAFPPAWAAGETTRVSVSSAGIQGNGESRYSAMSADGRFVAFVSWASNLVPDDTNSSADVFVHDREMHQTTRISVASDGTQANDDSWGALAETMLAISADGNVIAFCSDASNLVENDNGPVYSDITDLFVHDRTTHQTSSVSVPLNGEHQIYSVGWRTCNPAISGDGRYVTFQSHSDEAFGVFVHDRMTGQTTPVSFNEAGQLIDGQNSAISRDGQIVAFSNGNNGYIRDLTANQSTLVGVTYGRPALSGDGRFFAAANDWVLADTFLYDRTTYETAFVSFDEQGNRLNNTDHPYVSADGRFVAYVESPDVYVYDRTTGKASLASVSSDGSVGNAWLDYDVSMPTVSADGRYVAFDAASDNLVANDTNSVRDVFVHDFKQPQPCSNQNPSTCTEPPPCSTCTTPSSDLLIQLQAKKQVKLGKTLRYSIKVKNHSQTGLSNVTLIAQLTNGVAGLKVPKACSFAGEEITCSLGTLRPRKSKLLTFVVKPSAIGSFGMTVWAEFDAVDSSRANSYGAMVDATVK